MSAPTTGSQSADVPKTTAPADGPGRPWDNYHGTFEAVHETELDAIERRRAAEWGDRRTTGPKQPTGDDEPAVEQRQRAQDMDLFGLALSGGGIRAGTVALGVLQALASLRLLKHLDYISSVSGGGYMHCWLAAWIHRESVASNTVDAVDNVSKQLAPNRVVQAGAERVGLVAGTVRDDEPAPLHHLREHSRYMAPRAGMLSLDLWAPVSLYLRNLLANGLLFLALVMLASLGCRALLLLFSMDRWPPVTEINPWMVLRPWLPEWAVSPQPSGDTANTMASVTLVLALGLLLCAQILYRWRLYQVLAKPDNGAVFPTQRDAGQRYQLIVAGVIAPCLLAILLGLWLLGPANDFGSRLPERLRLNTDAGFHWLSFLRKSVYLSFIGVFTVLALAVFLLGSLFAVIASRGDVRTQQLSWPRWWRLGLGAILFGILFGLAWAIIINNLAYGMTVDGVYARRPALLITLGPPLLLLALTVAGYLEAIIAGSTLSESEREWRGRAGGMILTVALGWLALFGVLIVVPFWILRQDLGWAAVGGWVTSGVGSYLLKPKSKSNAKKTPMLPLRWLLTILPLVFLAGLTALASMLAHELPNVAGVSGSPRDFLREVELGSRAYVGFWIIALTAAAILYGYFIQPNLFSLHSVYGNRLIRCYLAASRAKWADPVAGENTVEPYCDPNKLVTGVPTNVKPDGARFADLFTGFSPDDDIPLQELKDYRGPYPLFNTTLNLVGGADLANQDRKGESFVLTPHWCGGRSTGWARLAPYAGAGDPPLTLGRAMTISGAAVDPNMQNYQSAGLTAFLTLFNLRLGWWLQNPWMHRTKQADPWTGDIPQSAKFLLWEAAGYTRADTEYVHLSDGGHFENTGAYELIRRRCRFIILVDAAEDPNDASDNLANLIRLVRTDFGIRVEIDTSPVRKDADGLSRSHAAVGIIRYDDVDNGSVNGTLLFVRSSLTGDEPPDVVNYARAHPVFPHDSAADLFFDEAQFESYRMLGLHIGQEVLSPAVSETDRSLKRENTRYLRSLFAELRLRWAQLPAGITDRMAEFQGDWSGAVADDDLGPQSVAFTGRLYPELRPDEVTDLRSIASRMTVMESGWLKFDLDRTFAHPLQRGFMNCLRRYTASEVFQKFWPVMRPQFSAGFVRFCERTVNVLPLELTLEQMELSVSADHKAAVADMDREFWREWGCILDPTNTDEGWESNYLQRVVNEALANPQAGQPCVWLVCCKLPDCGTTLKQLKWLPLGIAAVRPWPVKKDARKDDDDDYHELFFWIRGGYRSGEIGRKSLPELLKKIQAAFPQRTPSRWLMTRFPKVGGTAADSRQRAFWATFFNDNDFTSFKMDAKVADREQRLRRPLPLPM